MPDFICRRCSYACCISLSSHSKQNYLSGGLLLRIFLLHFIDCLQVGNESVKVSIDYITLQGDIDNIQNKNYSFPLSMIDSFDRSFYSLSFCEVSRTELLEKHFIDKTILSGRMLIYLIPWTEISLPVKAVMQKNVIDQNNSLFILEISKELSRIWTGCCH